jgi:hypothetical protein
MNVDQAQCLLAAALSSLYGPHRLPPWADWDAGHKASWHEADRDSDVNEGAADKSPLTDRGELSTSQFRVYQEAERIR